MEADAHVEQGGHHPVHSSDHLVLTYLRHVEIKTKFKITGTTWIQAYLV